MEVSFAKDNSWKFAKWRATLAFIVSHETLMPGGLLLDNKLRGGYTLACVSNERKCRGTVLTHHHIIQFRTPATFPYMPLLSETPVRYILVVEMITLYTQKFSCGSWQSIFPSFCQNNTKEVSAMLFLQTDLNFNVFNTSGFSWNRADLKWRLLLDSSNVWPPWNMTHDWLKVTYITRNTLWLT